MAELHDDLENKIKMHNYIRGFKKYILTMEPTFKIVVVPLINSWKDKYMNNYDLSVEDKNFFHSLIKNDIPSNLTKDDADGLDRYISNWINCVGQSKLCEQYVMFLKNITMD